MGRVAPDLESSRRQTGSIDPVYAAGKRRKSSRELVE